MSEPFLAELKVVSFNFAPKGWTMCNGQLLPINQNQAIFSLLGTTFGGNGQTTFALPNLQGRIPVHVGAGNASVMGQAYGEYNHTLTISELPAHTHPMGVSSGPASQAAPASAIYADTSSTQGLNAYKTTGGGQSMNPGVISNVGGSQPHQNTMPYLVLNWIIALQGIFPSRN